MKCFCCRKPMGLTANSAGMRPICCYARRHASANQPPPMIWITRTYGRGLTPGPLAAVQPFSADLTHISMHQGRVAPAVMKDFQLQTLVLSRFVGCAVTSAACLQKVPYLVLHAHNEQSMRQVASYFTFCQCAECSGPRFKSQWEQVVTLDFWVGHPVRRWQI